jgi:hypothetical protein
MWLQCWDLQGPRRHEQRDLRNLNLGDLKKGPNGGVSPTPQKYSQFTISISETTPITVAARSKAWFVFARLNSGIVDSNSTRGMDVCVCVYSVFMLSCVAALRRADPPSKESYRLCKNGYETEKEVMAQQRTVEPLMNEWMNEWLTETACLDN